MPSSITIQPEVTPDPRAVAADASVLLPANQTVPDPRDRHFDTSHLTGNLKNRTLRSGAITLSAQGVKFLMRLGSTAVLARLLTPADFGLISMVTVITGFVEMFKDAGLSMATVQREKITHAQVSTLFWINVALSGAVMLVVAALSPAIAWFYGEPRLLFVTLALSGTMICGGLSAQHQALLRRQMKFVRLAVVEIASMVVGIATAVTMARLGCTYWALVGMTAGTAVSTFVLSTTLSGWVPGLPVRGSGVRPMLTFGASMTASTMLVYFVRNGDNFVVGRFVGAAALGIYGRAFALLIAPWQQLIAPIEAAVLPALCRAAGSQSSFVSLYQRAVYFVSTVSLGVILMLAFNASSVVDILLGPDWGSVVPVFYAFIPAAIVSSVRPATVWLFVPLGRVNAQLRWNLITAPIYIVSYFVGVRYGAIGVAWAFSCCQAVLFLPSLLFACNGTFVRPGDLMRPLLIPLAATAVAAGAFFCFPHAQGNGVFVSSVFSAFIFAALCVAGWPFLKNNDPTI